MDNVRGAFTEAKRARDRYHDLLSVSSRSRRSARRHADPDTLSAHQAEREVIDRSRNVAEYQRRLRSNAEERQEVKSSPVSSCRLRSEMYPASLSRLVEGQNDSMEPGTR